MSTSTLTSTRENRSLTTLARDRTLHWPQSVTVYGAQCGPVGGQSDTLARGAQLTRGAMTPAIVGTGGGLWMVRAGAAGAIHPCSFVFIQKGFSKQTNFCSCFYVKFKKTDGLCESLIKLTTFWDNFPINSSFKIFLIFTIPRVEIALKAPGSMQPLRSFDPWNCLASTL